MTISPKIEIRPADIADVYALARNLREDDRIEVTEMGLTPITALRTSYRNAIFRRTAFVNGEIAAMWGLGGSMLGAVGYPWLLTAPPIEKAPVAFLREAKREVVLMLRHKSRLENHVLAKYTRACRFLEVLGFALSDPAPCGPNGALCRKFTMERG